MPVNVKIINPKDFVKLTATGTIDFTASLEAINNIISLIKTPGEYEVLIDTRHAAVTLTIMELYELGAAIASHPALHSTKIALLAPMTETEKVHFFETAALNRGVNISAFTDFEAAINWLVMKDSAA